MQDIAELPCPALVLKKANFVVNFMLRSTKVHAMLAEESRAANLKYELEKFGRTRFASWGRVLHKLLVLQVPLQKVVISPDFHAQVRGRRVA